jgi:hypothetical protein
MAVQHGVSPVFKRNALRSFGFIAMLPVFGMTLVSYWYACTSAAVEDVCFRYSLVYQPHCKVQQQFGWSVIRTGEKYMFSE